nr:hypothetical protein Iba_chr04dCG18950 [Ipomoea batatas]
MQWAGERSRGDQKSLSCPVSPPPAPRCSLEEKRHTARRRENAFLIVRELCFTVVTQNLIELKKNKRHAVADLRASPPPPSTVALSLSPRRSSDHPLLHVDEREGAKTKGRRISLLLPSFDVAVAGSSEPHRGSPPSSPFVSSRTNGS